MRSNHINKTSSTATLLRWFDAYAENNGDSETTHTIDWLRTIPFVMLHLSALFVFVVGWSETALWVALALYIIRMFAITGFYHRYFSHKTFKTSRLVQFIFAFIGATSVQRGPLWWAAHHRGHHAHTDKQGDEHSPKLHGFLWSHIGWFLSKHNFNTRQHMIKDFSKFPELKFLDRFDVFAPILLALTLYSFGEILATYFPSLGTNGWQLVVWGFVISTLVLYHVTFSINSIAHIFGTKPYNTGDSSRNNIILALLTLGEGWHNNHHYYPHSTQQGHQWWEIDMTYYMLKIMSFAGLIWDMKPVPNRVLNSVHALNQDNKEPA